MILKKLIKEWKIWRTVKAVVKQHIDEFYALNFDIDWFGRLYTIINIPDEIVEMPEKTRQDIMVKNMMIDNYIKDGLDDVTQLLNDLRLSDLIVYPDKYERFENTDSILLILSPARRYTQPWKVISYFGCIAGVITFLVFLTSYIIRLF